MADNLLEIFFIGFIIVMILFGFFGVYIGNERIDRIENRNFDEKIICYKTCDARVQDMLLNDCYTICDEKTYQ